jgi:hypothetical protein
MRRARWTLLAGVAALAFGAGRAEAYVRYVSAQGKPLAWPQTCIPLVAYPDDLGDLTPAEAVAAATAAAATWSAEQNPGSFLEIDVTSATGTVPAAAYDGHNVLAFRKTDWCGPATQTGACSANPEALAITSVFARADGTIVDGDIEVNAMYFVWADLVADPQAVGKQDLQNALTHEMGHLIGLDHPCYMTGSAPAGMLPVDNLGNPIPDCADAPADVMMSTMFPSAMPGDISKRTLAPDDQLAVREIYPKAQDPMVCPAPKGAAGDLSQQGCSVGDAPASGPGGGAAAVALLAGAALLKSRAKRRRIR